MATGLKKKYTQNDLRRLMNEQKVKNTPKTSTSTINSPLAKYPFQIEIHFKMCSKLKFLMNF